MTDDRWQDGTPGPWADLLAADATWAAAPDVEAAVVDAVVMARADDGPGLRDASSPSRRPALVGALAGVAAVVVLLLIGIATDVLRLDLPGGRQIEQVAVTLTAPDDGMTAASGEALLEDRPDGLWIALEVDGLPPAPAGQWYEATIRPTTGPELPAGSFHLRGGDGRVILWAGVGLSEGLDVVVERQPAGIPVLSGRVPG